MVGYIYKYTNTINGKVYIGKTYRIKARQVEHRSKSIYCDTYFHKALNKYGYDNFTFEIIAQTDNDDSLNFLEKMYIRKYKSSQQEFGYNLTEGGEGTIGFHPTEEARQKMSRAKKGVKKSEVTRQRMKDSWKLREPRNMSGSANPNWKGGVKNIKKEPVPREIVNQHISEAKKGSTPWNKGKKWSDEMRKKFSEAAKNRNKRKEESVC